MTVKLGSLKANIELEAKGDWIDYPDWPGVAFNVSSLNSHAYQVARDLAIQRLNRRYKGKPVPPDEQAKVIGQVYCQHILHGWRGFDVAYSAETALETLRDPAFRRIVDAVEWCAGQIGVDDVEFIEEEEKNSARPSAGS